MKTFAIIEWSNFLAELELLSMSNKATGKAKQKGSWLFYRLDKKQPKWLL